MTSNTNLLLLQQVQTDNPEIYSFIRNLEQTQDAQLSKFSHTIKNMISIISSSLQLIETQHPQAADYYLWNETKNEISCLIEALEQESIYRHSSIADLKDMNMTDLLWSLPDLMDEIYEDSGNNTVRNYSYDISAGIPQVKGDYIKLKLAFIQILKNAYEATRNNDTIIIQAHPAGNSLYVSFKDSGSGIDASILNQVTTPFFTTKGNHIGTGLSIAEQVATAHEGSLEITSDAQCTCITMVLPLHEQ